MLKDKWKKNRHKVAFYLKGVSEIGLPRKYYIHQKRQYFRDVINTLSPNDIDDIRRRVNYYNQCQSTAPIAAGAQTTGEFARGKSWAYYIDMKKYLLAFDPALKFFYQPGDVRTVPEEPTFLKSRPISNANETSVLLKLNRIRHYFFMQDNQSFEEKKNLLVWRGACHREHRQAFVRRFHRHPLCDVGDSHEKFQHQAWHKGFLSISQQLGYKFILSIEGNDVATNLKWIMASNSLCFMTRPRFETWFMEGALVPGQHYVALADDYSDLDEKIQYYLDHPVEAKGIIANANHYVKGFMDESREHLIGLLVMQKYFEKTGQVEPLGLGVWE